LLLDGIHRNADRGRPAAHRMHDPAQCLKGDAAGLPACCGDDQPDGTAIEIDPAVVP
jgi:hypothetical protein